MNLESYIRKYGYRPDYSIDDPFKTKYEKALLQYLGEERYLEFNDLRDLPMVDESIVMNFIGEDVNLLKLVLSSQIKISLKFLEEMNSILKNKKIKPKFILDLGGGDGWASDYLNETFKWNAEATIIDKYESWKVFNPKSILINCDYSDFKSEIKYELAISILGASLSHFEKLLECAYSSLVESGTFLVGVRIGNEIDYQNAIKLISEVGFIVDTQNSYKIESLGERLPLLTLKKSFVKYNKNDLWRITRQSYSEKQNPKRFFGIEGFIIYDLICDGKELSTDKRVWENGDFFQITVIEKNEIVYRVITNSFGNILIETPIEADDEFNNMDELLYLISNMPDFWNSSL